MGKGNHLQSDYANSMLYDTSSKYMRKEVFSIRARKLHVIPGCSGLEEYTGTELDDMHLTDGTIEGNDRFAQLLLSTIIYRWYWYQQAKNKLMKNLEDDRNYNVAKNIILFIGDGMGITTVTTARILRGQKQGQTGEENELAFDKFEYIAFAKTYNTDSQVGDSGACATALLCGVKGRFETVGLDDSGIYEKCESSFQSRIPCLADWAQAEGKSTGLVTTTRVTHATPAAMYGHSASRYWESDPKIPEEDRKLCKDIARQLVENDPGRNINVILGGGRWHFLPKKEEGAPADMGRREDGQNLIDAWLEDKKTRRLKARYVSNKREFDKVDPKSTDYLLGLFNYGHMAYEVDRDKGPDGEPSLAEMTRKAIEILRKNPRGYFLMVEGGRIDHSHHFNNAHRALTDTLALEDAVSVALDMTSSDDTLIVVTSDHSHVFAFGGNPKRGNPILGLDNKPSDVDNMPYTTLLYANGPGYKRDFPTGRENLTGTNTDDKNYVQQSAVPRKWDTHGGEDVPVYAHGPMAHLFRGVQEQTYVPHAMAYAACIGPQRDDCERRRRQAYQRQVIECPSAHRDDSAGYRLLASWMIIIWCFGWTLGELWRYLAFFT
ncbi:alkaline phosphatase, tissue-nonspecific isozyme [Nephila pilipes]|uniref:alkaline phosphatase n=1 Tax=Nephila pilipes TaxID=299642 RepID=A0A8X6NKW7_NEPPI|nr:alkaline phosphatase, tissue-nonspecific isozyme [Nephila pilipes]